MARKSVQRFSDKAMPQKKERMARKSVQRLSDKAMRQTKDS
jgi:hypothetical protein